MTIFLDMDGVIADFFGAFAKKNNVSHWKSIKQKEKALADLVGTDWFNQLPTFKDGDTDLSQLIINHVITTQLTGNEYGFKIMTLCQKLNAVSSLQISISMLLTV